MSDSAIESDVSQICPYCSSTISPSDEITKCSRCLAVHHLKCWEQNKGCTTFGCSGSALSAERADETPQARETDVEAFFDLVKEGNVEEAQKMLDAFPAAELHNAWLKNVVQPLHTAAGHGHPALAELLIERGADISAQSKEKGWTPLRFATIVSNKDVVQLLLSKSADCNIVAFDGIAPLHEAAVKGAVEIVRLLLDAGANANAKTKVDETPLHYAAKNGSGETVELLVVRGAHVNAVQRTFQFTPLHIAAVNGHVEAAEALLRAGADPNAQGLRAFTPLHEAAYKNNQQMINLLIKYGANPDMRTVEGHTPAQAAARKKQQTTGCGATALAVCLVVLVAVSALFLC